MGEGKSYKYIIFDWDGNVAQTLGVWLAGHRKTLELFYNKNLSDIEIVGKIYNKWDGPTYVGIPDYQTYFKRLIPFIQEGLNTVPLYEGAKETIATLKENGKKLALITNSERPWIEAPLAFHDIKKYFDVIVPGDEIKNHKPDPESFLYALEKMGGIPKETVVMGDGHTDILGGRAANMDTILFYPKENEKFYKKEYLLSFEPTYCVENFGDILNLI